MTRRIAPILALSTCVCALSGCLAVGGTRNSTAVAPTKGQQLIDLKRALDCGAITPAEYDRARSQFLTCSAS